MFRRGKNADERTFDFFLRSVTFFIILIVVLCISSFKVSADDSLFVVLGIDTNKLSNPTTWIFNTQDYNVFYLERYGEQPSAMNFGNSSYGWVNNLPASSEYDYANNYVFMRVGSFSGSAWLTCLFVPKDLIENGHIIFKASNFQTYWADDTYTLSGYTMNTSGSVYDRWQNTLVQGIHTQDDGNYTYHLVFANLPLYEGEFNSENIANLRNSNFTDNFDYLYNVNYYCYPDLDLCSSAYITGGANEVEGESNANHNYLTDIQVGLTSQNSGQSILSSQVIIGCTVDDWVLNNIDDYSMHINYKFYMKDSYQSTPNDPEFNYAVILPLRTFYNRAYTYSMAELFRKCVASNGTTFQSYFNIVGEGQRVLSEQPYNAIIPCFLESIYQGLGKYYVAPDPEYQTIPYTIFQFKFDVTCSLSYQGMQVDDASGIYLKEFDFKNGTESVKVADILRNENPWEGESEPQQSPIVPSTGNSNGSGQSVAIGGDNNNNINIEVGNGYQDTALHQLTREDIERNHQKVIDYINHMRGVFEGIGDEIEDDVGNTHASGFIGFLQESYDWIPGVDYITEGIIIIVAIAIIAFIFKCIF